MADHWEVEESSPKLLYSFRNELQRKRRPALKDLHNYVVPWWSSEWKQLGVQLEIGHSVMKIIEKDNPNDCEACCIDMLSDWLDNHVNASWEHLIDAVDNLSSHARVQEKHMTDYEETSTFEDTEEPLYDKSDLDKMYLDANFRVVVLNYDELDKKEKEIVAKVQAMLVVVNDYEDLATKCYLRPPDGSKVVLEIHCKAKYGSDFDPRIFLIGKFGKCPVAVTRIRQGSGRDAALHADKEVFRDMQIIIAVGVAAGFPENKVKLGDVLIAERVHDCSIRKSQEGEIIPRGNTLPVSKYMFDRLLRKHDWVFPCTKDKERCSVVVSGPFLSNSELLNDVKKRKELLEAHCKEAKGYEMEGFGIMTTKMDCIIVKGVCDYAGEKTKKWQPTAALAANHYLLQDLERLDLSLLFKKQGNATDDTDTHRFQSAHQPTYAAAQPPTLSAANTRIGGTVAGQPKPGIQSALLPPSLFAFPANHQDNINDKRDESDGQGALSNGQQQNNADMNLDPNKHNSVIKALAKLLCADKVNHRMLYRDFGLTDKQKEKIDEYESMYHKMYETLAQYVESKPTLGNLIEILKDNDVKQEHIQFLYAYEYR
ncbi:uncharacterized protein [Dysidea avara]|uniref:uncharacterized protein isoform X2 n=1 Tax=Dysidea avara TaxID=196820 RepID=UPI0033272C53